jgi:outer membrane lipoprotein-sorting protein
MMGSRGSGIETWQQSTGDSMNKRTKFLAGAILLGSLTLVLPVPAQDRAERLDQMREAFSSVKSIRTDFTQEKRMKILARPLVSEGRFFYRSPVQIRWEYSSPIQSVLLMDGGDVKRYTRRDSAWVQDRGTGLEAMRFVLQDISGWVSGDFESSRNFSAELLNGPPVQVALTPRDPSIGAFIQRVVLTLSSRPGVLKSVEIVEGPTSSTLIEFRNTEINLPFPQGPFQEGPSDEEGISDE